MPAHLNDVLNIGGVLRVCEGSGMKGEYIERFFWLISNHSGFRATLIIF